jgi:hypothetical protein
MGGRKESHTQEGLLTLNAFEMEKPESWPEGQTLVLDDTKAECANAQNQDPDCDDDRAEEQIPFSNSAHMRSPSNAWRVSGERAEQRGAASGLPGLLGSKSVLALDQAARILLCRHVTEPNVPLQGPEERNPVSDEYRHRE